MLLVNWIGFLLLAPVVLDIALLFRHQGAIVPPDFRKPQFRIQDLLVAIIWYGAFLFIFKPAAEDHSETMRLVFAAILPTAGFLFSMEVFSRLPKIGEPAIIRACLVMVFLSAFTFLWQISFLAWWLIECGTSLRARRPTTPGLRLFLLSIMFIYAAAFFLPVDVGVSTPFYGYAAYATCWSEALKAFKMMPDELAGQLWLANPMFWLSLSFTADRRWLMALGASGIALLIGLTVSVEPPYALFKSAGYVLWVASMAAVAVHSGIQLLRNKN
jgi:hypothetical protein